MCQINSVLDLDHIANSTMQELEPFGVRVVEVVTGYVQSNILRNGLHAPSDSRYLPIKDHIETLKAQGNKTGMPAATYARRVANQVTRANPPHEFWDGGGAWVMFLIVSGPLTMNL